MNGLTPQHTVRAQVAARRDALARSRRDVPTIAALASIVVGIVVLIGWCVGVDELKSIVPGATTMKANAAIGFILLGSGMLLQARGHRSAIVPLGALVVAAVLVGGQYVLGRDLGIDQWLFGELPGAAGTVQPGRPSPMTIICFLLLGPAVLLTGRRGAERIATTLLVAALVIGFFNILDAAFDSAHPTLFTGYTQMAFITAVTIIAAGLGSMALLPGGGPLAVFAGDGASARFGRRLIVASILVPPVLMWLWLLGKEAGFYAAEYGASLVVLGMVAFLGAVIHQAAHSTRRSEEARGRIMEERDLFFDVSIDMLATADSNGYFLRLNPAWTKTLGWSVDELTARPFIEFVHPDDLAPTLAAYALQVDAGDSVFNFQNRYRHRDGSYRWLEWTSAPSADGARLFAMARDITTRKAEEEGLAAMLAPARQAQFRREEAHQRIGAAIATRAFDPVYQPIVELASRRIVGFEALTRFHDGLRPDETFAVAVDCGLGIELEVVTMQAALHGARQLPADAWLSLNVSPAMVADGSTLSRALAPRGRALVLEITEHEAVTEYAPLRTAIVALGPDVRLAVDDAGAGVANFNHLVELRPDLLKIDVGLVRGVDLDVGRQSVVAGLVHFAASAGCQVIAEGIETESELQMVESLGVTLGQGFLLARPAPADTWSAAAIARSRAAVRPIPIARRRAAAS